MIPRWSVIATIVDWSSANLISASSLSERSSASPLIESRCFDSFTLGVDESRFESWFLSAVESTADFSCSCGVNFFEFLHPVAKLVARNVQEFRCFGLVSSAALQRLSYQ